MSPAPTFTRTVWPLFPGPLLMMPQSQLLVERVEVGLPEPGQLLIIFHSSPPADGTAEPSPVPRNEERPHRLIFPTSISRDQFRSILNTETPKKARSPKP